MPRCRRRAGASTRTRSSSRSTRRTSSSSAAARSPGWTRSSAGGSARTRSAGADVRSRKGERAELLVDVMPTTELRLDPRVHRPPARDLAVHQLRREDLVQILTEPKNALTRQYQRFFGRLDRARVPRRRTLGDRRQGASPARPARAACSIIETAPRRDVRAALAQGRLQVRDHEGNDLEGLKPTLVTSADGIVDDAPQLAEESA